MSKETKAADEKAARYSKAQILRSARYAKRRDLLSALLENGKSYTTAEIDAVINKFMKGKVR